MKAIWACKVKRWRQEQERKEKSIEDRIEDISHDESTRALVRVTAERQDALFPFPPSVIEPLLLVEITSDVSSNDTINYWKFFVTFGDTLPQRLDV